MADQLEERDINALNLITPPDTYHEALPDDDNDLDFPARGIWVVTSGTLRVTRLDGEVVNIPAALLPVAAMIGLRIKRIHETGTTAVVWVLY